MPRPMGLLGDEEVGRLADLLGLSPTDQPRPSVGRTYGGRHVLRNPDGTFATEESLTVNDPRLNRGAWTNLPSIWGGRRFDEDAAVELARRSGETYPSFGTLEEAEAAAQARTEGLGRELDAGRWWEGDIPQPKRKPIDLLGGRR